MTQEEKDLLFKDLCARLAYGVVCEFKRSTLNVLYNNIYDDTLTINNIEYILKDDSIVRPYLRPMSSMTREEQKELEKIIDGILGYKARNYFHSEDDYKWNTLYGAIDWLNAHHFDYRGLIPIGLALEAKPGMYNLQ